jgi:hypothetical protein
MDTSVARATVVWQRAQIQRELGGGIPRSLGPNTPVASSMDSSLRRLGECVNACASAASTMASNSSSSSSIKTSSSRIPSARTRCASCRRRPSCLMLLTMTKECQMQ